MIIFPAIDILDGKCVRLIKGAYETAHEVSPDYLESARSFVRAGAEYIHMVDLNGAKNAQASNREIFIRAARESGAQIQLGGGIRDLDTIRYYLSNGIHKLILGSSAIKDREFVKKALALYAENIAIGIDAENRRVKTDGWTEDSQLDFIDFAVQMQELGARYIIFTDISKDGTLSGPNFEQLAELSASVSADITASGGIRDMEHIKKLCEMNLYGAICGKSLYAGSLDLSRAIDYAKNFNGGNK